MLAIYLISLVSLISYTPKEDIEHKDIWGVVETPSFPSGNNLAEIDNLKRQGLPEPNLDPVIETDLDEKVVEATSEGEKRRKRSKEGSLEPEKKTRRRC